MAEHDAKQRVRALDVARLAEVSRSAVSRTFTPGASVAPATRARVIAAAGALGYRPPRGGAGDRIVAVVMANLLSPYFAELSERLSDELSGKGFKAQFFVSADAVRLERLFEDALASDIQGLICFSADPSPKVLAAARSAGVAVVLLNRHQRLEGASLVWIDGPGAGRGVAQMMLDERRRRPLALATTPRRSRELEAFAETMEAGGSAPCRWIDTGWQYDDGVRAADAVLSGGDWPDAVFAASDNLAIGFLDAARRSYGAEIPRDLSIVGFGNTPPSAWMSHRLSTVRLPIVSMIQTAVATLIARIESTQEPAPRIWLSCDIIERDTSLGTHRG